jgi:acetamidase/formamidase
MMAKTPYFPEDRVHYVWDNEQEPVITVEPDDTVVYHTREVSDGQIGPDSDAGVLDSLDWDRLYPLAGPVAMGDAEPGDVLAVEVLDIHTEGWG